MAPFQLVLATLCILPLVKGNFMLPDIAPFLPDDNFFTDLNEIGSFVSDLLDTHFGLRGSFNITDKSEIKDLVVDMETVLNNVNDFKMLDVIVHTIWGEQSNKPHFFSVDAKIFPILPDIILDPKEAKTLIDDAHKFAHDIGYVIPNPMPDNMSNINIKDVMELYLQMDEASESNELYKIYAFKFYLSKALSVYIRVAFDAIKDVVSDLEDLNIIFQNLKPFLKHKKITKELISSMIPVFKKIYEHIKIPKENEDLFNVYQWEEVYNSYKKSTPFENLDLESYIAKKLGLFTSTVLSSKSENEHTYFLIRKFIHFYIQYLNFELSSDINLLRQTLPYLFNLYNNLTLDEVSEWPSQLENEEFREKLVEEVYINITFIMDTKQKTEMMKLFYPPNLNKWFKLAALFERMVEDGRDYLGFPYETEDDLSPMRFQSALLELARKKVDSILSEIYEMSQLERKEAIKTGLNEMCKALIDYKNAKQMPKCVPRYLCLLKNEPPARKHTAKLLSAIWSFFEAYQYNRSDLTEFATILKTFLNIDLCEKAFPGYCPEEYLPQNLSQVEHPEL